MNIQDEDDFRQLARDLATLAVVPNETISAINAELSLDRKFVSLKKIISKHITEHAVANAIGRIIAGIDTDSVPSVLEMIQDMVDDKDEPSPLTENEFELLTKNLRTLVQKSTEGVVARSSKASALMNATGNEVTGLAFVCDARPVYNESRSEIEGYVPLTTMRIYFDRPNDESDAIEFVLTPAELDTVIERANQAKAKLNVMQLTFSRWIANGTGEDES